MQPNTEDREGRYKVSCLYDYMIAVTSPIAGVTLQFKVTTVYRREVPML